jgi:hypothetical protein
MGESRELREGGRRKNGQVERLADERSDTLTPQPAIHLSLCPSYLSISLIIPYLGRPSILASASMATTERMSIRYRSESGMMDLRCQPAY